MFVCCCLGTADPKCTADQGELGCNCTAAVCTCTKEKKVNCEFADDKLKCSYSNKACPDLTCTAPVAGLKTAICVKAGDKANAATAGKFILSAVNDGGDACAGNTTCTPPTTNPEGPGASPEEGKESSTTVPASKDDTNSEDPAGA